MSRSSRSSEPGGGGLLTGASAGGNLLRDASPLAPVIYLNERFKPAEVIPFPGRFDVDGLLRLWQAVAMEPYGGDAA